MPKIRCHYLDCTYLDDRYCVAAAVEINPDTGCTTYTPNEEAEADSWGSEEDDWDGAEGDEEHDDLWANDDESDEDEDEDSEDY